MKLTQYQHYSLVHKKLAEQNELFLYFVNTGMTREDLATNIARRPHVWGKFEHWLDKLPSTK